MSEEPLPGQLTVFDLPELQHHREPPRALVAAEHRARTEPDRTAAWPRRGNRHHMFTRPVIAFTEFYADYGEPFPVDGDEMRNR